MKIYKLIYKKRIIAEQKYLIFFGIYDIIEEKHNFFYE
jgi:hypothetical protein